MSTILLASVLTSLISAASRATSCFPGEHSLIKSHSKSYSLRWEEPRGDSDTHHLLLRIRSEPDRELLAFHREVCVLWSPSDAFLAVSDYLGSNAAEVYIYDATRDFVKRDLIDYLPKEFAKQLGKSTHGYAEATGWHKSDLQVHVWGNMEVAEQQPLRGFNHRLSCAVGHDSLSCGAVAGRTMVLQRTRDKDARR